MSRDKKFTHDPVASTQALMQQLLRQQTKAHERDRKARVTRDLEYLRDKTTHRISNFTAGMDMEAYLDTVERELTAGGIDKDDWECIIAKKLDQKTAILVSELIASADHTYDDMRDRLCCRTSVSNSQYEMRLFKGWEKEFSQSSQREHVNELFTYCQKYFAKCIDKHSYHVDIAKGLYRAVLPLSNHNQAVLDSRTITTEAEFFDVVDCLQCLEDNRRAAIRVCARPYPKPNHNQGNNTQGAQRTITCFNCGEKGHKSPNFSKAKKTKSIGSEKPKLTSPSIGLAHVDAEDPLVLGEINSQNLWFRLDTGASLSVIPRNYVKDSQMLTSIADVTGFDGTLTTLPK